MKLLSNSNKVIIGTEKYSISSQAYTRDFKSFPLISVQDGIVSSLTHYKNPVIFTPSISSTETSLFGSVKYVSYTGLNDSDENHVTAIPVTYGTYSTFSGTKTVYKTFFDGKPYSNAGYYCPQHTVDHTNNFYYGCGNMLSTSSTSYVFPLVEGCMIRNKKGNSILDIRTPYNSSYRYTNSCNWSIIDTNESRDIVAFDMNINCGYTSRGSIFVTIPSGITTSNLGVSNDMCNDVSVIKFNSDGTASAFTKNLVSGSLWNTTCGTSTSAYRLHTNVSNAIKNEDGTYTAYVVRKGSGSSLGMWKLIIDESNMTCSIYQISSGLTDLFYSEVNVATTGDIEKISRYYTLRYNRDSNGNCYLSVILSNSTTSSNVGVFSYKINEEENTAEFKGRYTPTGSALMGYYMINDTLMLCASPTGYELLLLDFVSGTWNKVGGKDLNKLTEIVYDDVSNSLFYRDSSNYLYMDRLDLATAADWGWDDEITEWTGENIETSIHISCSNCLGNLVKQNVLLTISGNAVFKSNNQPTIKVSTSESGPITVPVTIIGDGIVTISGQASVSIK